MFGRALGKRQGRKPASDRSAPRIALSPTSWGVSDIPDWGHQLDAERVLSDVWSLGIGAIEAGPPGFLPDRSDQARPLLRRHWLRVVAGEAQAVLHHHDPRGSELAHVDGHASWLAAVGAETLVLTAIPPRDEDSRPGSALGTSGWARLLHMIGSVEHACSRHRLRLAVMPRHGSMIQGPAEIERLLVGTEAGLCLDIGHLVLLGADPLEVLELAAGRIQHVRLNDVDRALAARVREEGLDYTHAVGMGLFKPLGSGDARVERVVEGLRRSRYRGWYAIQEEVRLTSQLDDPLPRVKHSLEYAKPMVGPPAAR
jgi:inosose dehydratase